MAFKAVFLDRDNTIIEDPGYINHPDQVHLLPGAAGALFDMKSMGYKLIIVSNQSGVARGIVTEEMLNKIHERLLKMLRKQGVFIDGIYYCPYLADGVIEKYRVDSDLRKPKPGMLLTAAEEMDIDLTHSWMIGDAYRDIEAGKRAGCMTILVNSQVSPAVKKHTDPEPDCKAVNIKEAANIIKMCVRDGKLPYKAHELNTDISRNLPEDKTEISGEPAQTEVENESTLQAEEDLPIEDQRQDLSQQCHDDSEYYDDDFDDSDYDEMDGDESMAPEQSNKTKRLLSEMLNRLNKNQRNEMFEEFSLLKVFAGIIQIVVFFFLAISLWFMLDPTREPASVHTMIGFAITFQLMAIAFFTMDFRK